MRGKTPGEFELVVLLTLASFEEDATGRLVYDRVRSNTGREISVAAVHITLTRLHEKGWAESTTTEPAPGVGGKPRRHYSLSVAGAQILTDQRSQLDRLWDRAHDHPLLGGGR